MSSWGSFWGFLALTLPNGFVRSNDLADWFSLGSCDLRFNNLTPRVEVDEPESLLRFAQREFGEYALPFSWVQPSIFHSYREPLQANGFEHVESLGAMTLALHDRPTERVNPQVQRVFNDEQMYDWLGALTDIYHLDPVTLALFQQSLCTIGYAPSCPIDLLSLAVDGKVVSIGASINGPGATTIQFVGTREAHRRKGYGKKIVGGLIQAAMKAGNSMIVLHSTQMAMPMYRSTGFQHHWDIDIFEPVSSI